MSLNSNNAPIELDVRDMIRIIRKRKVMIAALVVAAMMISGVLSLFVFPKEYKATATISIIPQNLTPVERTEIVTIDDPFTRLTQKTKADYMQSMLSASVLTMVIDELALDESIPSLLSSITLQNIDKTDLVGVSVTYSDPRTAQDIAQALCVIFENQAQTDRQMELEDALIFAQSKLDSLETSLKGFGNQRKVFLNQHDIEAISKERIRLSDSSDMSESRLKALERQIAVDAAFVEALRETVEERMRIPASDISFEINMNRSAPYDGTRPNFEVSGDTLSEALLVADYTAAQLRLISASYEKTILEAELVEMYDRMDSIDAELIEFSGEYDDLVGSIELTQSKLKAYRQRKSELTEYTEADSSAKVIRFVSEAVADAKPVSPNVLLNVLLAGIMSLFLGLGAVYFMDVIWMRPDTSEPAAQKDEVSGSME